ncbi:SusC/RagA family TonB-linked outer membrane protein [Flavobacterium algicola]|uniref:SusC/RagA family TonB-linked outer membrane protein n=1 Tax=Flavobacterium algicola TaxID=556529 RepID=UPI001EFD4997|nr:TonB-dependent receptor [Flavobacterium algicola]MCG9792566.1 TonB-dependent receptor [Flavobacterium algicola]
MYFKFLYLKQKSIFLLMVFTLSCHLGYSNETINELPKIKINSQKATLISIFSQLSNQTGYKFSYGEAIIQDHKHYEVSLTDASLISFLNDLATKANFDFNVIDKLVLIKKRVTIVNKITEQQLVKGTIVDEMGLPLPGATIIEKGTKNSSVASIDGMFQLNVAQGRTVEVSYVGYKTKAIVVKGYVMTIKLEPDASELTEVMIVGYGKQSKIDVTGSVTQLKAENFKQGVNISADNLLQGKVAGVRVVGTSGEPGAGVNVSIRGVGSIRSGSTPLFVVDGVPLSNDDVSPSGTNVGFGSSAAKNPLNFLNTSDIESITVLKDASASAIYGARGSNGVVIITTKKGTKGEASFTVDSYMGFSSVAKKLDVLTADEYRSAITEPAFDHGGNTDWQDVIYRTAITKNNSLSFAKQSNSGNYYVSLAQMDQEGIVNQSNFKRTSGRINAAESFLDNQRLKVKVNLTASETKDNGVPTSDDGGSNGQLIIHTLMANPTRSVFDENGEYTNFNMNAHYNPAYLLSIYEDETRTLRVLGNVEASFRIVNGLEYKLNYGIDRSIAERNTTIYPNKTDLNPLGKYVQNNLESQSSLLEHYLTYSLNANKHKVEILGGFSYQKFERSGTSFSIDNIASKDTGIQPANNPGYQGLQSGVTGFAQENELQSYFGRVNYTFDKKYLLTASMRADGSTRFGNNNKYGYFPSFALGWNINEETFLKESSVVDNLKLRSSWGQTGNQEVQNKITQASYALSGADGYYLYDDLALVNGISVARTPNPNLKWEVVTQYNVGLDFNLWKGKLYGTLDYFNKTTTDAILNIPSQVLSPTNTVWVNIDGNIVNKGLEFMLGSQILKTQNFSWDIDVNGATLNNEIKNLPVSEILSGTVSGPGQSGVLANIYKSGYAAGSFYLLDHIGFDENGANVYRDTNGDNVINNSDRIIIEGAIPKLTYGFNSMMRYKNFDFSFSIIGQSGGYLLNNTGLNALNINNLASDRNVSSDYFYSGANATNAPTLSTLYLEKSDFIRLNTARLGYNFQSNKIKWMQGVTLYITGQNLLTFTNYSGYDPLINSPKSSGGNQSIGIDYSSYPTSRTFILGATLKL